MNYYLKITKIENDKKQSAEIELEDIDEMNEDEFRDYLADIFHALREKLEDETD